MNLWEYKGQRLQIVDTDGQVLTGSYSHYTSWLDDPDGVGYLTIDPENNEGYLVCFTEDEIASIEIITSEAEAV